MKTKNTPGPWAVCSDGINVYAPETDTAITGDHICAPDHSEGMANARLIAAAPELKAALVECVQVLGEYTGPSLNGLNSAFENAITAIAKAKED